MDNFNLHSYFKKQYLEESYQNLPTPDKIQISYTDPGFRFYGMYLFKDGKRFAKISFDDTAMIHIDWTGANGTMDLYLPDATAAVNVNRSIRFISDSTFETRYKSGIDAHHF